MIRRRLLLALLAGALSLPASAQVARPGYAPGFKPGMGFFGQPVSYVLDQLAATPVSAYSTRRLRAGYSGAAFQLMRTSDNLTLNVGFAATGDADPNAIATFCAGTTCGLRVWFDQSGNGNDAVAISQPGQPVIYASGAVQTLNGHVAPAYSTSSAVNGYQFAAPNANWTWDLVSQWISKSGANANPASDGGGYQSSGFYTQIGGGNNFCGALNASSVFQPLYCGNISEASGTTYTTLGTYTTTGATAGSWAGYNASGAVSTSSPSGWTKGALGYFRYGSYSGSPTFNGYVPESINFGVVIGAADITTLMTNQQQYWGGQ